MTATDLESLIACGENATVEFKRARGGVPTDFWPSYSAFANTEGGLIVLGVRGTDGKREIEGLTDVERICADLWNAANNAEKVSANVLFNSSVQIAEERSGMGLSSLYGVWERQKYTDPILSREYDPDRTKVVVEFESEPREVAEKKGLNDLDRDLDRKLDDLEKNVLRLISEDGRMTYARLAEQCSCAIPTIQRRLSLLQKQGLIRRVGPDKGGHWEVIATTDGMRDSSK